MQEVEYNKDTKQYKGLVEDFLGYCQNNLDYDKGVSILFIDNQKNSEDPLGNTGYYNPESMEIGIFTTNRHIKDILRSLGHELVHHEQNCDGKIDKNKKKSVGYAQEDEDLRDIEKDAYVRGNLLLRDYEDKKETSQLNESLQRKSNRYKDKFGFHFKLL